MTTIVETPGGPLAPPAAHSSDGEPAGTDVLVRQDAQRSPKAWIALASFAGLALLMYVSIMLKIMKYGP
ncbi:hypothetical protein [Bradyrhizobium sp.]|uniref:hypothetical protein n=1 Tax=Bradyrhizobium sp. TaxID=376 RepID=UPI00403842ED